MPLKESGEMYLETISILSKKSGAVRSVDVANSLGYSKPSVSRAVGLLKEKGYIVFDENGHIRLTDSGTLVAEEVFERHTIITKALTLLGVEKDIAAEDACRIEHIISKETFNAIKKHINNI